MYLSYSRQPPSPIEEGRESQFQFLPLFLGVPAVPGRLFSLLFSRLRFLNDEGLTASNRQATNVSTSRLDANISPPPSQIISYIFSPKITINQSIVEGEVNHLAGGFAHDNRGWRSQFTLE